MDEEQTPVRVAWLYHREGLTQAEIASRLGLTRLRVNRLLAEARDSGLVQIAIASPLASCVQFERQLEERYGLTEALVVPTPDDAGQIAGQIGRATAALLSRRVEADPKGVLGVGWGATLRQTIRHLAPRRHEGLTVAAMMGGLTYGIEINTFEIATGFASAWQAQCHYLAAPIYAGTPASRDTILAQDVFQSAFDRLRGTRLAVLSAGDLSPRSLLVRYGLPSDVGVADLAAAGAVGDLLGQFIDADGRPVDHALNRRAIAMPLANLAEIPTVVLASGGLNKAAVIGAALKAKLASVLVTDEATAGALLAADER